MVTEVEEDDLTKLRVKSTPLREANNREMRREMFKVKAMLLLNL